MRLKPGSSNYLKSRTTRRTRRKCKNTAKLIASYVIQKQEFIIVGRVK